MAHEKKLVDWNRVFIMRPHYEFFLQTLFSESMQKTRFIENRKDLAYLAIALAIKKGKRIDKMKLKKAPKVADAVTFDNSNQWHEVSALDTTNHADLIRIIDWYVTDKEPFDDDMKFTFDGVERLPTVQEIPNICMSVLSNEGFEYIKEEFLEGEGKDSNEWSIAQTEFDWKKLLEIINND